MHQGVQEILIRLLLLFLIADLVGEMLGLHVRVVQFRIAGRRFPRR